MSSKTLLIRPGSIPAEIRSVHGDFQDWFIRASDPSVATFEVLDPTIEPLPTGESLRAALADSDRVLVTGSQSAAYANLPWIEGLESFIRDVAESEKPLFGVCFGAQIIATALGGSVEVNPKGREAGTAEVELLPAARQDPFFRGLPERFAAQSHHDDYVVQLPEGAELLATNSHTRVQAYRCGARIHAVQFHPEITAEIMRDILQWDLESKEITGDRGRELISQVAATPVAWSLLDRFFT